MSYTIKAVSGTVYTDAQQKSNGNWEAKDNKGDKVEVSGHLVESKKEEDDDDNCLGRVLVGAALLAIGLSPC